MATVQKKNSGLSLFRELKFRGGENSFPVFHDSSLPSSQNPQR